jgi:dipeptidyl aminopeptidase/acylaminoacyl peptidase
MPARRAALLLLLLPAVAAPPAAAAFEGRNGAVAYVGEVDDTPTLLVRRGNSVGGVLDGGALTSPAWSPQGRRLVVVRGGADGQDLWTVAHDGLGARQITNSATDAIDPAWSPTGGEIAFADGAPGARHIYAVTADGGAVRQVTNGTADERDPAWSATGRIAYVVRTSRTGDDIYSVPAAGGSAKRLTRSAGNDHSPSWSPDGRRLAFVRAGAVWVSGADGRRARRIVAGPATAPAWAPRGNRIVFSGGRPGARQIFTVGTGGRGRKAISTRGSDGRTPDWQPAGFDPVIAAAGDIACDPTSRWYNNGVGVPGQCGQLRTSNLLLQQDFWKVLALGDTQNSDGALEKFLAVYEPTWGRVKYLTRPVIGNHEYVTAGSGYFDYFNGVGAIDGPAGDRTVGGYYSFDVGTWHVIALNSMCNRVPGGCDEGSPQQRWLAADLAAHPNRCTLAMWHHPRYSSHGGGLARTHALWQTFAAAGGDVVLTGHHHFYERMAPIDGVREFIIGVGGGTRKAANGNHPSSEKRIESTLGVLKMRLGRGTYDWRFLSASADPATDVGSDVCH